MTTETPRTDAKSVGIIGFYSCATVPASFSRELERELAASKAEIERLKVINADMRIFLSKAIHNEGFNEKQALKFIYQ